MIDRIEARLAGIARAYAPDVRWLALIRIAFGIWVIAFPVDVTWIADVPAAFFHPRPGLFAFLAAPPSEPFLVALTIAKVALGIALTLGIATMPVSVALSVALIVGSGVSYSYSKVDHFILFELTPVFLACAGWGWKWSMDNVVRLSRDTRLPGAARGMPVLLFAMTIGWAMLSAAAPKAAGGWLDPDRSASRGYLVRDIAYGEKLGPLGPQAMAVHSDVFWKLLDYATLVAEGGLILMVFWPMAFRLWLLLLASFHVGVFLTLGISFADYILVYAVFFAPVFTRLVGAAGAPAQSAPARVEVTR